MLSAALLACAASIHPITLNALVSVESHGNPISLHVNGLASEQPRPRDAADAAKIARFYIARGFRVDIGLSQIDSSWLPTLGLTVEQVMEPCTNLQTGGAILAANYRRAVAQMGAGRFALKAALGAYNTGSLARGGAYAQRIELAANYIVPSILPEAATPTTEAPKAPPSPPVGFDMLHPNKVADEPDAGAGNLLPGVAPSSASSATVAAPQPAINMPVNFIL